MAYPNLVGVSEAQYNQDKPNRIRPTVTDVKLGWFCVCRVIYGGGPEGYFAVDFDARVSELSEPDQTNSGRRLVEFTAIDLDGRDVKDEEDVYVLECEMATDGMLYSREGSYFASEEYPAGSECGYLVGGQEELDPSQLLYSDFVGSDLVGATR